MSRLVMMRHGQSEWNKLNIFTGWVDIPMTLEGIQESLRGGKKIADIPFDVIFTSTLTRAQMTAMLVMSEHKSGKIPTVLHPNDPKLSAWEKIYNEETAKNCIPVIVAWQLNERMYGELQGMNKQAMRDKYGDEQVKIWRRSFDVAPPKGESLAMTAARAIPYFKESIVPYLEQGKNVFISAHGNSLRAIVMHLEGLSKEQVIDLEIETGKPLLYHWRKGKWERESI